ncbi:hypothetical protein SBOR_4629 [Sclerotinia borealis F-4128]|uniref:C2H2-type domain-containing protein n=1 Tax=Sclerotinia borealis (strain F-4128) TaxID=1432307 RepID=W9CK09_SCLBF|nr:hypothetical protein SBOR_4629 [Sclerotinia borealis F-4128]
MTKRLRDEEFDETSSPDSEIPSTFETQDTQSTSIPTPPTSSKIVHLDQGSGEGPSVMRCSLPGHHRTLSFLSYDDYEVHYKKSHMNRCLECRKNFPSEHFLNLHIEENHDALVSVRKDRGEKTYSCFVEDCDRKCSTFQKRRMHLIDKHMFPQQYDFFVVNDGIDHKSSMLRSGRHGHRRHSSAAQWKADEQDTEGEESTSRLDEPSVLTEDDCMKGLESPAPALESEVDDMKGLETAMSALRFVPSSVRFGRGRGRGRGFSRRVYTRVLAQHLFYLMKLVISAAARSMLTSSVNESVTLLMELNI